MMLVAHRYNRILVYLLGTYNIKDFVFCSGTTEYLNIRVCVLQIAAGSMTVLAIGPGLIENVNSVTGHLKLL